MKSYSLLREFIETLIAEGGAVGHLQHLYDNLELTFGEIKEVISNAAEGKLEKVSEKLDGINLVFTWDASVGQLKAARSGGDIKGGGMDAEGLAKKFFGRGNVEVAFNTAFKVLNEALNSLSPGDVKRLFGDSGNRWYSMEIIYAADPNTINYDSNNIVFHGWPIFEIQKDGSVGQASDDTGIDVLTSKIEQMQSAISEKDWKVRGPSLLSMKKMADGSIAQKTISEISSAMSNAGVSDTDTVFDYLRNLMLDEAAGLDLPPNILKMVIERCVEAPGAPGIPEIKKATPKEKQAEVVNFVKNSESLKRKMVEPIEMAIHRFAIEVLRGVNSTLINDSDAEVSRLRKQVEKAISAIEKSGNQTAMEILQKEMERLGNVENIGAAMEGIVFFYKGQAYKFTGAFAPAHQLLSLFKYGRKGIPKMDIGETLIRNVFRRILIEGGHAFSDVEPIALEKFKETWPHIKKDLEKMGCTEITFIGSTGKKALMGDVDLAAAFAGTREEFYARAEKILGADSLQKIGSNIVTMRYPVKDAGGVELGEYVQVDVMLGNPSYLSWARFGTSTIQGHKDYSPVKGVVRNALLNTVSRIISEKEFPGEESNLDRTRYSIDLDKGLFKVTQTKRNKIPGKPPTKEWKTLDKVFVTDDPEKIVEIVLGKGIKAKDIRRFEDFVAKIMTSPLRNLSSQIFEDFIVGIRNVVEKTPQVLGKDPEQVLEYIEQVIDSALGK